jgi:hypothetical protein
MRIKTTLLAAAIGAAAIVTPVWAADSRIGDNPNFTPRTEPAENVVAPSGPNDHGALIGSHRLSRASHRPMARGRSARSDYAFAPRRSAKMHRNSEYRGRAVNGHYVGTDPDPLVREELHRNPPGADGS